MSGAAMHRHGAGITWVQGDAMARAAHALRSDGRVWLVDPFEDEPALAAVAELGAPAAVVQLLDRHNRDGEAIAARLGVPRLRLPAQIPDSPFTIARVVWRRWWHELALWWPDEQTLVVAEALGTAPAFALDRPVGVHPMLRLTPPRAALSGYAPERLLVGHGAPLDRGAAPALGDALDHARGDIPQLVRRLPSLIGAGRQTGGG